MAGIRFPVMMLPLIFSLIYCAPSPAPATKKPVSVGQIVAPEGFTLQAGENTSFAAYLSSLNLKKDNTVYLYNGTKKTNQDAQYAVLDLDVGGRDLQQCADAAIRLHAEYLFKQKKYDKISYHFVNGQECAYTKYAEGYRAVFKGNRFSWVKKAKKDYSYPVFRNYLDLVFSYAGTASLIKELKKVENINDIMPGDVFIQSRNPYGHAVTIMAVAKNTAGEKYFLLAQSYMPAQDIHILKNPSGQEAWYKAEKGSLITPEWTFDSSDLRRW